MILFSVCLIVFFVFIYIFTFFYCTYFRLIIVIKKLCSIQKINNVSEATIVNYEGSVSTTKNNKREWTENKCSALIAGQLLF